MKCPICTDVDLVMSERQKIEIDYCPKCRGVWLDRGELDKIIERSTPAGPPPAPRYSEDDRPRPTREPHRDDSYYKKRKKKESFLSELFDF
jgi:hypothetical protein